MNIKSPLLLDGGLSNELEKAGYDLNHKLWSARLLESDPQAIVRAHLAYLRAGVDCIITSSYQASVQGFLENGIGRKTAEFLILKTVKLAEEAIELYLSKNIGEFKPLIAASIGPYGAYLANGSEYRGNYGVSDEELKSFHESRIKLLDTTNADFFACETIPSFQEAKVLANLLEKTKKQAWITFSCKDGSHINDGTPIKECITLLKDHPNIFALGVNCTAPKYISGLIENIKQEETNKRIVVYPNSGEVYHVESKSWQSCSNPGLFAEMAKEWVILGADIIGGCCRIGPEHIEEIRKMLL